MNSAWIICLTMATIVSLLLLLARKEAKNIQKTKKELKAERRFKKYGI